MTRRDFIKSTAAVTAGAVLGSQGRAEVRPALRSQPRIPRWRGFNLTELAAGRPDQGFVESDFAWMAEWGFDFARLPMSYWTWADVKNWKAIDERALAPVDQAIELGAAVRHSFEFEFPPHPRLLRQRA